MQCMKCGREAEEGQVFCPGCLDIMARNPVKPNTVVTIPERSVRLRTAPRKQNSIEDTIEELQRKVMQLRLWVCMLLAALLLTGGALTWQMLTDDNAPTIGQNYTSVTDLIGGGGGR